MADLTSTNIYGNLNVTGSGYVYGDQLYSESVISINKYSCKMVLESEGFGSGNAVDLCIPIGTAYTNFRLIALKVGHGGSSVDPEGFIEKHYSGRSYNNTLYNYVSKVMFNPTREVYAGEFSVVSGVLKVPLTHTHARDRNMTVYLDCFADESFINAVKEAYFSEVYVLAWPGGQYETIPERLGIGLGTAGVPNCALEISNNGVLKISGGSAPDWPTGSGLGPELAADTDFAGVGTTGISTLMSYDRTALAYKDMYYNAYSHVFTTSGLTSPKMYISNAGKVGIGTTAPSCPLDVQSTNIPIVKFKNGSTNGCDAIIEISGARNGNIGGETSGIRFTDYDDNFPGGATVINLARIYASLNSADGGDGQLHLDIYDGSTWKSAIAISPCSGMPPNVGIGKEPDNTHRLDVYGTINTSASYAVADTYIGKTFTMTYISAVSINLYKTSTPYGNLVYDATLSVTTKQADIRGGIVVSGSAG